MQLLVLSGRERARSKMREVRRRLVDPSKSQPSLETYRILPATRVGCCWATHVSKHTLIVTSSNFLHAKVGQGTARAPLPPGPRHGTWRLTLFGYAEAVSFRRRGGRLGGRQV